MALQAVRRMTGITLLWLLAGRSLAAGPLGLQQVLQQVIDQYPGVESALLQVRRARLNAAKTRSQLGWQLQAQAGIQRDASPFFGTALDVVEINSQLARQLESGGQLGISAGINRQNSEDSFAIVPNPVTATSLDIRYRKPLARGADNPAYAESGLQAEIDAALAQAQRRERYDQLADQIIELFTRVHETQIRMANLEQAIARSLRRQHYLQGRRELGVAEQKDLLQVEARIKSQRAERQALQGLWQSQRIQLNRLMGRPPEAELVLRLDEPPAFDNAALSLQAVEQRVVGRHPAIQRIESRLQLADSQIRLRRNDRQDQLDLVMFVGNRSISGDVAGGSTSESELVGGLRLEYQQQFDKHAVDAELEQALLDRDLALLEKQQLLQDIQYDVADLLGQIHSGEQAWRAYRDSVSSEQRKLEEAEQRYRSGRSDTEQLITFESQLAAAELSAQLQRLSLMKNHYRLQRLTGELWQGIRLPGEAAE